MLNDYAVLGHVRIDKFTREPMQTTEALEITYANSLFHT